MRAWSSSDDVWPNFVLRKVCSLSKTLCTFSHVGHACACEMSSQSAPSNHPLLLVSCIGMQGSLGMRKKISWDIIATQKMISTTAAQTSNRVMLALRSFGSTTKV